VVSVDLVNLFNSFHVSLCPPPKKVAVFKRCLSPAWAKRRWYLLLAPLEFIAIGSSAIFVRSVLFPEVEFADFK